MRSFFLVFVLSLIATASHGQSEEQEATASCTSGTLQGTQTTFAVRDGPGNEFLVVDDLDAGTAVSVCAQEGTWYGIHFGADQTVGWVPGSWLGLS